MNLRGAPAAHDGGAPAQQQHLHAGRRRGASLMDILFRVPQASTGPSVDDRSNDGAVEAQRVFLGRRETLHRLSFPPWMQVLGSGRSCVSRSAPLSPPLRAISRCFALSIDAKPRLDVDVVLARGHSGTPFTCGCPQNAGIPHELLGNGALEARLSGGRRGPEPPRSRRRSPHASAVRNRREEEGAP